MIKILIVSSVNKTTAVILERMKAAAEKISQPIKIQLRAIADAHQVYGRPWDVVILAPQVSYIADNVRRMTDNYVIVMPTKLYALGEGKQLLDLALRKIKEREDQG